MFVHPSQLPAPPLPGPPPFAVDFLLDTTRAAANLVLHGVPRRYPNLKIILSHAGGFLPYAAHWLTAALVAETGRVSEEILEDLRSFWFDTATAASRLRAGAIRGVPANDRHVVEQRRWTLREYRYGISCSRPCTAGAITLRGVTIT
ncbi:hypothetical protein [Streptomyces sp. NPDC059909]|uniref:hypothetical protein n=1 Tax=Streptomyces sp. NPDC059909 TaxID=3346998 RepID=UPI00365C29E9